MNRKLLIFLILAAGAAVAYKLLNKPATELVLTGIVTADEVVVSPQMSGRLSKLMVAEGDTVVQKQVLAILEPGELQADRTFFARSAEALESQVRASEAELSASIAQEREATANLAQAKRTLDRTTALVTGGALSQRDLDDAKTAYSVAESRAAAAERQVTNRRSAMAASGQQQEAAKAQSAKADVRLGYAEVSAPISGIVDVRAARVGEVVGSGQPILTLINPDSLWVRADLEESYIDRVRLGQKLRVRLPWGEERLGTVFYRGVDAEFATQRDVSRTKRDIKTFQIRLRLDNKDRRLAVGMTASVLLPSQSTP